MSKWKCEICNNEFDNFQAQGFNHKIYCPLCYFKELNIRKDKEIERLSKEVDMWNKKYNEQIDIINELEKMFDGDLDGFQTINEKGACNNIIEVIQNYKDKLKALKEGK